MIQYRHFRNTDPPALVDIWNEALAGRGSVRLRHSSPLERHVFCKPYFDPAGLIVAEEDGTRVGFVHAGFGPDASESCLSTDAGVICLIAVRPAYQRRGVGSELLRRAEDYLCSRGARSIYAGPRRPRNPFYLGLYGGAELPGFLESDPAAEPFFSRHGYNRVETSLVFQRRLDQTVNVTDGRFAAHRRRFEVRLVPRIEVGSWWQESVWGLIEPVKFRLEEKGTGQLVAHATAWEMEGFSWRWNLPAVGLVDLWVSENLRRQGLGKFLLANILRYLQEQFFGLTEVQTTETNIAATCLCRSLGFQLVDRGHVYRKVL
ncbi:MAG: GNAT family N-acetyltransferase [Gemmataceae bacterium]|nr:GNAT family N-acetyltransferase [Gemmataceae bacterium]MDW8266454.1 GNAT family N-acetyltransferase [Gemmataceae bacterium]